VLQTVEAQDGRIPAPSSTLRQAASPQKAEARNKHSLTFGEYFVEQQDYLTNTDVFQRDLFFSN
jgi:hypothetical protein